MTATNYKKEAAQYHGDIHKMPGQQVVVQAKRILVSLLGRGDAKPVWWWLPISRVGGRPGGPALGCLATHSPLVGIDWTAAGK